MMIIIIMLRITMIIIIMLITGEIILISYIAILI